MTLPVLHLKGAWWTIASRNRTAGGYLTGTVSTYSDPARTGAEHLVQTVNAAQATYEHQISNLGLTGIGLQNHPQLVQAEIPEGDYVDAVTSASEAPPSVWPVAWGQDLADDGYPGIALPLLVAPPVGTPDLSVYVFIPLGSVGLRILRTQQLP